MARRMVGELRIDDHPHGALLVDAGAITRQVLAQIEANGVAPVWAGESRAARFAGRLYGADVLNSRQITPEAQRGVLIGFAGAEDWFIETTRVTSQLWRMSADGGSYEYTLDRELPKPAAKMTERRRADRASVFRRVSGATLRENTIPVGPLFVPPPLVEAVAQAVAEAQAGAALVETSALEALGMTYALYLPAGTSDGLQWVSECVDFRPIGMRLGFNAESGLLIRQVYENAELTRVASP